MRETIAVLSDAELLRDHLEGVEALSQGDSVDTEELSSLMQAARRLPSGG